MCDFLDWTPVQLQVPKPVHVLYLYIYISISLYLIISIKNLLKKKRGRDRRIFREHRKKVD